MKHPRKKILILRFSSLGDLILTSPFYREPKPKFTWPPARSLLRYLPTTRT